MCQIIRTGKDYTVRHLHEEREKRNAEEEMGGQHQRVDSVLILVRHNVTKVLAQNIHSVKTTYVL